MSETERAKQYQIDVQARERDRLARELALAGNAALYKQLVDKTIALTQLSREWEPEFLVERDEDKPEFMA